MRFQATKLQATRDPRFVGPASLSVGLEISWEPRLRPISLRQKLDVLEAKDEHGAAIDE
jgi:hypothetical protein